MCDDVAQWLVVNIASRVNWGKGEGLIHLENEINQRVNGVISWESAESGEDAIKQTSSAVNLSAWFISNRLNLVWKENKTWLQTRNCNTVKVKQTVTSYSSLLTKPVPLGSKSLKAARMVSSGSVPEWRREEVKLTLFSPLYWEKFKHAFDRTIEFFPKQSQEHGEVDGTLPFI